MFWELLILLGTVLLVRFHLYRRHMMEGLHHLPVVQWNLPLIGACYRFLFNSTEQIMTTLIQMCGEQSTPTLLWFGPTLAFCITKPEDMKAVYTSPDCLGKPYMYKFFGGSTSIFTSPVPLWKKNRRAINPTFNNRILQSFVPVFNQKVTALVGTLRQHVGTNRPFNVGDNINACTLEMVCATTIGHDVEALNNKDQQFCSDLAELSVSVAKRILKVWLHIDFLYSFTAAYRREQKIIENMFEFVRKIREVKQAEFEQKHSLASNGIRDDNAAADDDDDGIEQPPLLFVNEMLKMYYRGETTLPELDEHLITMIVGGNETSALTTSNAILLLAMFPAIQERCYREIERVYGNTPSGRSTVELTAQLEYMEMCIKETMRLLPVGPFLARECTAPTKLSNCTMPAGTLVVLGNYNLHRDKSIWGERANEFDPEHFRPERVAERHPFAYVPFSGGPRNCVGIKYAWISVKVMLAEMLRHYRFRTDQRFEDLRFKWDITLKLSKKHMVYVERRRSE